MARPHDSSSVASHPRRAEIEAALATHAKAPYAELSARHNLSVAVLRSHRARMMRDNPALFAAAATTGLGMVTAEQVSALREKLANDTLWHAHSAFLKARHAEDQLLEAKDWANAVRFANVTTRRLELIGQMCGELARHSVNIQASIVISPEWQKLRAEILRAMRLHPGARADLLSAFQQIEAESVEKIQPVLEIPEPPPGEQELAAIMAGPVDGGDDDRAC
jgi:hypothetical protein